MSDTGDPLKLPSLPGEGGRSVESLSPLHGPGSNNHCSDDLGIKPQPCSDGPSAKRPPTLMELSNEITKSLRMSGFDKKQFLPRDCFDQIFSERNIDSALSEAPPELLEFIKRKARKVFATVLHVNVQSKKNIIEIMTSFYREGFEDKDLLLDDDPKCERLGDAGCSHPDSLKTLHKEELWSMLRSIRSFFDERWIFLAPIFTPTEFSHKLSPNAILPFEWVEEDDTKNPVGGFSKVQKATIHISHQTVLSTNGRILNVAIKELQQSIHPNYPLPEAAWELELRAIKELRNDETRSHEHLTPAIGAFQRRNKYYLVFQWADGGSLRSFWEKHKKPSLSSEFIEQTLQQLNGLADALIYMHESKDSESPNGHPIHWRHGDIKPDNILRFKCTDEKMDLGTLRVADLGLAVRHMEATTDRKVATTMRWGTMKYEGPEAHPYIASLGARSRRYDVWSMGCVVLEFLIWMLFGHEGLQQFDKEPLDQQGTETNFYKVEIGHMEVNSIAQRWMKEIGKDQEMKNEGKPTAMHDLLELVEKRLLVVGTGNGIQTRDSQGGQGTESFDHRCRATADELKKRLEIMIEKGKENPRYLFTGKDRKDIQCPRANVEKQPLPKAMGQGRQSLHPGTPANNGVLDDSDTVVDMHIVVPSWNQNTVSNPIKQAAYRAN